MSLSIGSTGAAGALPAFTIHSHGHKKGAESSAASTDSTASTSSTSAQAGSTQSLFSNLLTSMEQVIGAKGSTQATGAVPAASLGQTNTQVNPGASTLGGAATSLLGTIGSALRLIA